MEKKILSNPKVAVVILNWNRLEDTVECIKSVYGSDYSNFEIIIVDNGSTDNSVASLRNCFENICIVENKTNLGYAEGNNAGIRQALIGGAQYVWLLNNDTVVDKHALSAMMDLAERNRDIGILSGKILYFSQPDIIWFAGATIDWKRAISAHIGRLEKDTGQFDVVREVDRVTGCSMLIRKEVLENVGLFDGNFFLYAEEVDLCIRARKMGYRNYYVPKSVVYHKVSISSGERSEPLFDYYNTRNFLFLIWKHFKFPVREILLTRNITRQLFRSKGTIIRLLVPGIIQEGRNTIHDIAPLKGILHFLLGKMGEGDFKYFMTRNHS